MHRSRSSKLRRLLLPLCLVVLVVAGCQVRTEVTVRVEEDGSGEVELAVGLDADAVRRLPDVDDDGDSDHTDLAEMVRTADLEAVGWEVSGPETDDEEVTWLRIVRPFGTPDEAGQVLAELTGTDGGLSGWEVTRETSFGRDRFSFAGTADLGEGLRAFSDEGLAAALEGAPLGEDPVAIEERLGQPMDEMFLLEVAVELPGGADELWEPVLGGAAVEMEAESTVYNTAVWLLVGVAALCLLALVLLYLRRLFRR